MPHLIAALALASSATPRLSPLDLALVAVYLIGITLFGLSFRKRNKNGPADKSLRSYFLADNTIPWWAIALSVVSAETSTLTIISVPGVAFAGDFGFLQLVLGYMLGRIVVAALFLPRYFAGEMLTAYQLIDQRFGPALHKVTAGLFLLTRAAAEGVRVFAVSIVVGLAIGTKDVLSIGIISALTLLYTFEGGMAAVVWTDVVQMAIYIGGTVVALLTLGSHVAGGWPQIHTVAAAAGKFHMFNFALNLTTTYTFWAGVLGGTFLTMASHGTDQLMVQRLLAARSLRESRLALLSSGAVIFLQFALFLLIGAGLYVFYQQHPGATFRTNDYIFPTFIVRQMPLGIAGLLVAAILAAAMSNLSAALNSLSSTTVVDFYLRLRPSADARERALISKSSTVLWALVLFAIAVYSVHAGGHGHVVEIGLSIASVAYGCLLGVFLLGTLTHFATQTGAILGMISGFALNLWLWQGSFPVHLGPLTIPHIAWTWYVLIGAAATFLIGSLASLVFRTHARPKLPAKAATTAVLLLPFLLSFRSAAEESAFPRPATPPSARIPPSRKHPAPPLARKPNFSEANELITSAIREHKLPGAVLLIGHGGRVLYTHAYGSRKVAHEPGPTEAIASRRSRAEAMTANTIFDMASLSKCLSTATAIMQLYEQGKLDFDDPVVKYLPAFATSDPALATAHLNHTPQSPVSPTPEPQAPQAPPQDIPPSQQPTLQAAPQTLPLPTDPLLALRRDVTIRMLLTHTSGEPADVYLKDPWGLAAPDKAEGLHRALVTPLQTPPTAVFRYSDINFILLGAIVESLSGQTLDVYAQQHIFKPLGMTSTRYLPVEKACGPHRVLGAAISLTPGASLKGPALKPTATIPPSKSLPRGMGGKAKRPRTPACPADGWRAAALVPRIAPTQHDTEGSLFDNPDFDHLLRGTVHDPTTRRMGGVAGHAGVFSTAHDVSLYAQALLDRLAGRPSKFPLTQATLQLMTTPEQPNRNPDQLTAATQAEDNAIALGEKGAEPGLAPRYPAIHGQDLRGFGWDIDTAFSKPRGLIFPIGSFGHTGFTGTSLWMDPGSNTYVILLANAIHPHGATPISNLRGEVATATAQALHLYPDACTSPETCPSTQPAPSQPVPTSTSSFTSTHPRLLHASFSPAAAPFNPVILSERSESKDPANAQPATTAQTFSTSTATPTLTGIDVLEATHFAALSTLATHHSNALRLGVLTNQTGVDAHGRRTVDILAADLPKTLPSAKLTAIFSPEHGIFGAHDSTSFAPETDPSTGLRVTSLYGPHDSDKRPSRDQLKDLDLVVIDLQDAGVRTYTYEAVTGYFLEAAAKEQSDFGHTLDIVVLDRPNPISGATQGPVSDPGHEGYTNYTQVPLRHGLTIGELARYYNSSRKIYAPLTIVPLQHWTRGQFYDQTGLPWVNPSPNLHNLTATLLLPGLTLLETVNVSVGRGTSTPFELFGAGTPPAPKSPATTSSAASQPPSNAVISTGANHKNRVISTGAKRSGETPVLSGASAAPTSKGADTPWFHAAEVATFLNARHIPGVSFTPTTTAVDNDPLHPFHGQTIEAVRINLLDRDALNSPELGIEILSALHHLYPTQFHLDRAMTLLASRGTLDALTRGDDPRSIAATWEPALDTFRTASAPALLYH